MKKIDIDKISILPNATLKHAMQTIGVGEIGAVFLVEKNGNFKNLLTDGDIRRSLLKGYGLQSPVTVIEKKDPVVVKFGTPLNEISNKFNDKIKIIPVVNNLNQIVDVHFKDKRAQIPVTNPFLDEYEIELLNECIISGWVSSGGPFVKKFESLVAEHTGTKYAVSCSSGTSGLHLALLANDIGPGDEVIVPTLTFIATANAVRYTGAKPVFVDSDINTWNIDPKLIKDSITSKTKAIMAVHLYGLPADMDSINQIAKDYNLLVIEDASEAQGAKYKNKMVGSLADMAVFSFFGNKIITTGEGGMIVTNDKYLAEKCRLLRDHGMSKERRYWHQVLGYNYRMTNMQAALGVAQMGKIEKIIEKKKQIAKEYKEILGHSKGVIFPAEINFTENVFWLFTILIKKDILGISANELMQLMQKHKIDTRPVFPPIHTQPIYNDGKNLQIAEKIHSMGITLPSSYNLKSKDIQTISNIILNHKELNFF